jgi:hypothetical protein
MKHKSEEEKVAEKIANLVSDLRLDIEQVGVYVGRTLPSTTSKRLLVIAESAENENIKATSHTIRHYD